MLITRGAGHTFLASVVILFASCATPTNSAKAGEDPMLAFDFGRTVACRDVTPADYAEQYPDERIVEFTLRLSVYLKGGNISDVESLRVEINDDDARLVVRDFAPSTKLESEFAGDIEWTKTTESSHELGASLGGEIPCLGGVKAQVTPSISGGIGGKEVVTESQKRVAPRQVVVASGTMNEEHGVFFTLRPSPTTSLEGVHDLTVRYLVPTYWRGDAVRVSVQATGQQKVLWVKQPTVWAQKTSAVALYLAGDAKARTAAARFVKQ